MKVEFEEVLKQFYLYHDLERKHEENTNNEAANNIILANELLNEWHKVFLKRTEILEIVLPWHESERGKMPLIPKTGLTVKETVEKLQPIKDTYEKESSVCWSKILKMNKEPFTPIFLSTKAIDTEDYKYLDKKEGLIHLDGLHRMISWGLNNLLTENAAIEAYIAGAYLDEIV